MKRKYRLSWEAQEGNPRTPLGFTGWVVGLGLVALGYVMFVCPL
jgi:hypothetical protein